MVYETRSRTGKKPPPKPHFDEIASGRKKVKPKAISLNPEPEQPVAKKAKGGSKRRKVKASESSASTETESAQSSNTQNTRQLEVLTEDEECEVIPQERDMTRFRVHYQQLGELFQSLFTPDPELAAAYLRVERETNKGLKKLKEIKSKNKNEPAKAISHTPMGKKLLKIKGKPHVEEEPIVEEVHDSSFESVASSKASVNFVKTPMKTPARALRSRKIRKSVLAVPKSPWRKERVTRAKAKKGQAEKKGKPPKGEPAETKQVEPSHAADDSVVILSPSSSEPSQPDEAKPTVEVEVKKTKKQKTRPAKRKVEESESDKEVFKVPSDFNFENHQKLPNPPRKQRILGDASVEFDQEIIPQLSKTLQGAQSQKEPSQVANQTLPANGLPTQPAPANHNLTTTCIPDKETAGSTKVKKGKVESSKKTSVEVKSSTESSNSDGQKMGPTTKVHKSAEMNPVVVIEKLKIKKTKTAKKNRKEKDVSTASTDTTITADSQGSASGTNAPPCQNDSSLSQKLKPVVEGEGTKDDQKLNETKVGEKRTKKTSLKEIGSFNETACAADNKKPIDAAEGKIQVPERSSGKKNTRSSGNITKIVPEKVENVTNNATFYVQSPGEGNTTVYVDRPNDTFVKPGKFSPNDTFAKPEQSRPNDTFTRPEQPRPNDTFTNSEQGRPNDTFTKPEQSRPNDTFTKPDQFRPNTTVNLSKSPPSVDSPTVGDKTFTNASACTPIGNATFVVPQKGDKAVQLASNIQNCNTTFVLPKEQEPKAKIVEQPPSRQAHTSETTTRNQAVAIPDSEGIHTTGGFATKKLPPLANKVTKQEILKPKLSGQEKNIVKNKVSKGSSSSSVCSTESVSSTTSKPESVAGSSRGTPKSGKLRTLSPSRDRYFDAGSHSKPPAAALELKKQEDHQRLEKKRMEGIKKKELYLQQKQEMQRKKNEEWKAKIEKKKAEEEAEKHAKAEQDSNKGYVKTAVQGIYKLLAGQGKGTANPVSKVMQSSGASAASCPDIHKAGTMGSASSASSCSSMSTLKTQAKVVQIAQKVFGSVDHLQNSGGVSAIEKSKVPSATVQKPVQKALLTKPADPHKFLMPTPPSKKQGVKPHVEDIFDTSCEESFMTVGDKTLDSSESINTYDITVYEDLDENMEHRANKRIPDWANDRTQLNRSLFLQQPALLGVIRRPVFPQKNVGYKLFPNVPF